MIEEWRPIPWNDNYVVSNTGHICSLINEKRNRRQIPRRLGEHKLVSGHLYVRLAGDGSTPKKSKSYLVHRLVMLTFNGDGNAIGLDVAHINGDPTDNRLENLVWATRKENNAHKKDHGTQPQGCQVYNAIFNERAVRAIRALYEIDGISIKTLAERFATSKGTIGAIVRRKNWRHVD